MAWNPMDQPVDFASIGGLLTPGKIDIMGAGSPRNWDQRMGYGWSGSFPVFTGMKLSEFSSRIRLYTTEDWDHWDVFKIVVEKPPAGKRPRALDIWHPFLEMLDIRSVVVTDCSQPEPIDELGTHAIVIKWMVFRRPKITLAKPEASEVKPKDEVEQEIEALTKEFNRLKGAP
jgi:hypothetical protein